MGKLKRNKKEKPPEFLMIKKSCLIRSKIFGFQDISFVSQKIKSKRTVMLLSSMHDSIEKDAETKKLLKILDYKRTNYSIDSIDQLYSIA